MRTLTHTLSRQLWLMGWTFVPQAFAAAGAQTLPLDVAGLSAIQAENLSLIAQRDALIAALIFAIAAAAAALAWVFYKNRSSRHEAAKILFESDVEAKVQARLLMSAQADRSRLLRENNHTVKNNLQTISSLLNLQKRRLGDGPVEQAKQALREIQSRLDSMSYIQRRLYEVETGPEVNIRPYICELVEICVSRVRPDARVAVDAVSWSIDVSVAAPLGLIVSELLANAVEHGLASGGGHVQVSLARKNDTRSIIEISHDGAPLPQDFDLETDAGLGLAIVSSLVKDIDGGLVVNSGSDQTVFVVEFSNKKNELISLM